MRTVLYLTLGISLGVGVLVRALEAAPPGRERRWWE